MHEKKRPSEEKEKKGGKPGARVKSEVGIGPDLRRSLEALASQTKIASWRENASRERVGRNRKSSAPAISSGTGKDSTSSGAAGAWVTVNAASHMVMNLGFMVANRRHSSWVQIGVRTRPSETR